MSIETDKIDKIQKQLRAFWGKSSMIEKRLKRLEEQLKQMLIDMVHIADTNDFYDDGVECRHIKKYPIR